MTATGLLYYFGTKERLLREVVAERDRMETIDPDREFPLALTLSSLRELGRHNVETAILTRLYLVLGAESLDPDDPLHDFFVERYEVAGSSSRALLNDEKAQGRVRPDVDVDQVALEVIAMIMGARVPVGDRPGPGRLRPGDGDVHRPTHRAARSRPRPPVLHRPTAARRLPVVSPGNRRMKEDADV